jgi:DNA-binding MarR family transcriptional regulator
MAKSYFGHLVGLERTGALRLLVKLMDGDMFISELIRRHDNQGIASQPALEKTRTSLVKMGLIEEREVFNELTRKTRLYLGLTDKGREVAEGIQRVALILSK